MDKPRTRLAPSPTGALHMGNARTFLINWALAVQGGWRVVLRIEDLDGPRVKTGADELAMEALRWLGMGWDEGPYFQRHDLSRYQAALASLAQRGLIYPCRCSRSQIASAQSAPHGDEHELRYPGTCRPAEATSMEYDAGLDAAWRLRVLDAPLEFVDRFAGRQSMNPQQSVGDFVVATRAGLPAYQLAVVVDDAQHGVTQVVRGDDLITSTPRQLLIYRMLGLSPEPAYTHVPLVLGPDGRRLAKRHGDTRIEHYRKRGVAPERIIGLIGHWCGLGERSPLAAGEFAKRFDLARLPREHVTFTEDDERWLLHT